MDDSVARPRVWRRVAAYLIPAAVPAVLVGLYHLVRLNTGVMDAVNTGISAPARAFLARVSSGLPFVSLAETLCTALVLWVLYHIIRTVSRVAHRRGWRAILLKRLYAVALVALYIWALFCWLWGVGYFASGFAARSGLGGAGGVELQDLYGATVFFANLANERSGDVARDDGGHFAESVQDIIALSDGVYDGISGQFPALGGAHYPPKPMLYSRVYSRLGFTGFYFALTGESNINTDAPRCLMPSTVAHELAHQLGVFAEEEANFAGIAACVTSGIPVYEYSGALSALLYLSSALRSADYDMWEDATSVLCDAVRLDWADNNEYWAAQRSDTGVGAVVSAIYDGYLKSNGQALGIKSYGACVDLLVEWVISPEMLLQQL